MKKASFSFRAVRAGSYLHRYFFSKMSRRRLRNVALGAAVALYAGMASAQCDTFRNADAVNPVLVVLDTSKTVAGFAFADIDGDGDEDLYVNNVISYYPKPASELTFYRNVGTKLHPVFKEDKASGFGSIKAGHFNPFMQFVDIDDDGDLDYYCSGDAKDYYDFGSILFYENKGTRNSPKFIKGGDDPLPYLSSHIFQPFSFADVDADGDLDLYACDVSGELSFGYYQRIYYNSGSKRKGHFDEDDYIFNTIDGSRGRTYYDWNKDGLLDFFGVDTYFNSGDYLKNVGPKNKPHYTKDKSEQPQFGNGVPYRMIDLNNDGAPEVFDFGAHYSVLTPVAVIKDSILQNGNTALYSENKNAAYTYRWEYNGNTIAGATRYYIVPKQTGTYTLFITGSCGTGVSLNYQFKKTNTQPFADEKTANFTNVAGIAARAYPNPFVSFITLQLPGTACTVRVMDMAGRILLTQNTSATSLQLGKDLKAGVYKIEVWQAKERIYQASVVKQ